MYFLKTRSTVYVVFEMRKIPKKYHENSVNKNNQIVLRIRRQLIRILNRESGPNLTINILKYIIETYIFLY